MKISFIIASINQDEQLKDCIGSIEKAYKHTKGLTVEVIVVFQGIKQCSSGIESEYPAFASFYYIDKKGLSIARNYAIRKSKGDLLVFMDDHAQVKEDFLDILEKLCLNTDAEVFCGKIIEQETGNVFTQCFRESKPKYLNRVDFKYFMGSSHILRKSAVKRIGFYDEDFGAGAKYPAAEETDMFFRLKRKRCKVFYSPELVFFHPALHQIPSSKVFDYFYAAGAMFTKQLFCDKMHCFAYLSIIIKIICKNLLRVMQIFIFPKSIESKNAKFHYRSALFGIFRGILDYTGMSISSHKSEK